jgi:hypothetical protein
MDEPVQDVERKLVWALQIIVVALVAGSLAFLVMATVLARQGIVPGQHDRLFGYLALGAGAAAVLARLVVGHVMVSAGRRRIVENRFVARLSPDPAIQEFARQFGDRAKLFLVYFTQTITTSAILEGAAFFATIVYLCLDRSPWNAALAACLIGLILIQFPTRRHIQEWVDRQLRLVTDERQLRG